jgi:hypothetical protein
MAIERRKVPRYSAHVKATIKVRGEDTTLAVMVEDLCVLGCLLEYAPTLEVDAECEFALTWKNREFRTPAVVVWKGERDEVGLKFQDTDSANHPLLREFCADFLEKPLVRLPDVSE